MKHSFTKIIKEVLEKYFGENSEQIFKNSELIQYLNIKTVSADRGSKSRGSFANIYAIYVLIEDYIKNDFHKKGKYSKYDGAIFSDLFKRQRELPFGAKLQNHALNHRMNQEFKKYFSTCDYIPIIRVVETKRYWINENLLIVKANKEKFNLAEVTIEIIDKYVETKKSAFDSFIKTSGQFKTAEAKQPDKVKEFILSLIEPNVDARIFEIVSYSILKYYYKEQSIFFGFSMDTIEEENLKLYKTGRTNANDGGIDFVMKPLGRFFQVTETTDVKKYFLDIDKLEKFPVTFVVKSTSSIDGLKERIRDGAIEQYNVEKVVEKYMDCIEEIINIDSLKQSLDKVEKEKNLGNVLSEIIKQSKVEFNYEDDEADN
ncbi:MAG: restriction endonuclease [Candidatus Cloacimonetes bacterium 4572_55]|nr:MAG: restriction endonuclease [Candidatus Cloacimonetes bacterium 4572_55]